MYVEIEHLREEVAALKKKVCGLHDLGHAQRRRTSC